MGIHGLNLFLKTHIPEVSNKVDLTEFRNKRVGIDTSIYLYKFKYNNNNFIELFTKQIFRLKLNNITPIYIFDGIPPIEKKNIIQLRKKKRDSQLITIKKLEYDKGFSKNLFETIIINTKIENLKKKIVKITTTDINSLKHLLKLCGVSFIQSKTESDLLFNSLSKYNYIDMVLSEDNDLIVNSDIKLIKYFNIYSNKVVIYDRYYIITKLGLTSMQWIHFCILMGCDYFKKIPYSSEKTYKLIKMYNIEEDLIKKIKLEPIQVNYFKRAKELFLSLPKIDTNFISNTTIDILNLKKFIKTNTKLSDRTINYIINIIDK
jgi:5'-3' exonuclease